MAIKKTEEAQFVIHYMNKLGLKPYKSNRQFWDELKRRYDKELVNQLNEKMKGSLEELYELKNSSLQLSLDFSKISAELYRRFFDWLVVRKGKAPKKILDVGCDNGIVTCFLASVYPEAEVIGIDRQANAISRAKELAEKLNVSNVSFITLDINEDLSHLGQQSFDLIVSLSVFHEVMNLKTPPYWTTRELLEMDELALDYTALFHLRTLLKNNASSELVTCERLAFMGDISVWAKALTSCGFHIQWDEVQFLHFQEFGEQQKMPIFVTKTQNNLDLLEKIYAFEAKDKILQWFDGKVLREPEAEIVFEQTTDKELIKGIQINFSNGSGNMRIECWETAEYVLLYQYTNIGYRELKIFENRNIEKVVTEFERLTNKWTPQGKIFVYDNVEEREQFIEE